MTLALLRLLQEFLPRYSWKAPANKNRTAMASSHVLYFAAMTLRPARPNAPTKLKGKQHANVESAVIIAATGVARSAIFIKIPPIAVNRTLDKLN